MAKTINLTEYMAYLENKVNAKEEQKAADFSKRMADYERAEAADLARRQMNLDELGGELAARENQQREAWEAYKREQKLKELERTGRV